jgi:hypothetical protein
MSADTPTEFKPISIQRETFEVLARQKGPGKTWDRYIRELANLPLEVPA